MTKDEADRIQDTCDEVIAEIVANPNRPNRPNWVVNWADLSCRDVLVSVVHPNDPPTLKIEEASPDAWGFAQHVANEMEKRTGLRFVVETEW
jgi:hypothetical protein